MMEKDNKNSNKIELDESILLKYIREKSTEEESSCVEKWLQEDEKNEKILLQIASIEYSVRTQKRIASRDPSEAYMKVQKRIDSSHKKIYLNRICVAVACFIGVLIMSSVISFLKQDEISGQQIITVQANAGMRTHFNLPDGTVAYLNSGSKLSYPLPYDKGVRKVELTGEAYFEVAHKEDQPFVVSVSNDRMRVKVLGTEFNLQSYEGESVVHTTLVSGSVNIEMVKNGHIVSEANLKPSEKAVYDTNTGSVSIVTVNTAYDTAWKDGRLMFKDMPLPEVFKKLAYFYNVRFEVRDPVINTYCFTGTFENKQLSQVLDYLKISSQIDYTIKHIVTDDSSGIQYETVILEKKK